MRHLNLCDKNRAVQETPKMIPNIGFVHLVFNYVITCLEFIDDDEKSDHKSIHISKFPKYYKCLYQCSH